VGVVEMSSFLPLLLLIMFIAVFWVMWKNARTQETPEARQQHLKLWAEEVNRAEKKKKKLKEKVKKYESGKRIEDTTAEILMDEKLSGEEKKDLLEALNSYTDEEIKDLIRTAEKEKSRAKLREVKINISKKAEELFWKEIPEDERQRTQIPDDVKIFVWKRDGGKCVKCGSIENLEYDHIIPFSKGGSNTERNIQLLCEKCNREKHDKIDG